MDAKTRMQFSEAAARDAAGDYSAAEALLSAAVANNPNWPEGLLNLGVARKRCGDWDGALLAMRQAQVLAPNDPTIAYNLGVTLLDLGNYEEGLALFERRSEVTELAVPKPHLPFPEWSGEDVSGKRIVIWPDQGFGDQIQSARFAPLLRARGAEVTLICAPALARLFKSSLGVEIIAAKGAIEFSEPDFWALGLSLPHLMSVNVDTIPAEPYLAALKVATSSARIGVATKGDARHANDRNRSLSPLVADRLLAVLGNPISLHPEDTGAGDFADTAALIAGLDLVVTVDTSIAHLAGAMGKPVWIMLPHRGTDWRWMRQRVDSPWYPTATLFRQDSSNDWNPVIERIAATLQSTKYSY